MTVTEMSRQANEPGRGVAPALGLALRHGWRTAALAHAIANTFATTLTLLLSGGQA